MKVDKITEKTRPAKAGKQMGEALVENIHLLYLDKNAVCYLNSMLKVLLPEFDRRKKDYRGSEK